MLRTHECSDGLPAAALGFTVVVTARARWVWTFDEDVVEEFDEPGGGLPGHVGVLHLLRAWRAVGECDDVLAGGVHRQRGRPFAVPGAEISKTVGPIPVPVREARSQLIGG